MDYPSILKNGEQVVLAYREDYVVHLIGRFEGMTCSTYNFDCARRYGKEYLQNTYGVVESKEHAEFIIELAPEFRARSGFAEGYPCWFCFDEDDLYFFDNEESASDEGEKQILISPPPKVKPIKKKLDMQVGDDVVATHPNNVLKGKLLALTKQYAIISLGEEEQHLQLVNWKITKAKTPEEELRDDLVKIGSQGYTNEVLASVLMEKYKIEPRE